MSAVEQFVAWSGWGMSVLATAALVREWRGARRARAENATLLARLERLTPDRVTPVGTVAEREDGLRSLLIDAASHGRPFAKAIAEARRAGAVDDEVYRLATTLRADGLLAFDEPLTPQTTLTLNR